MIDAIVMLRTWLEATGRIQRVHDQGASLVEYALLLALIALICIAALTLLGGNVSTKFSDTGNSFAGM